MNARRSIGQLLRHDVGDDAAEQLGPERKCGRAQTTPLKELKRDLRLQRRMYGPLEPGVTVARPRCRADCINGPRPCPWVGCKWNLYLEVSPIGSLQLNFPELEVDELPNNCALDLADRGGMTLEQVGQVLNVVRERVRQIEAAALDKMRIAGLDLTNAPDGVTYPARPWHERYQR